MKDIRIVHDAVGVYADWEREQDDQCESMKLHRYLVGNNKPNYPVPAIPLNVHIRRQCVFILDARQWPRPEVYWQSK